jgi:hypothetical protein
VTTCDGFWYSDDAHWLASCEISGLVFFLDADSYFWTAIVWIELSEQQKKGFDWFFERPLLFLDSNCVNCALG